MKYSDEYYETKMGENCPKTLVDAVMAEHTITVKMIGYGTKFNRTTVYIGRGNNRFRKHGSPLCNPFLMGMYPREKCISLYREYLFKHLANPGSEVTQEFRRIVGIARKTSIELVCHCSPKACHGDVIKEMIEVELGRENVQITLL